MKVFRNENGVTLLELLLSLAILSIILTNIMGIFPQMGHMNQQNRDKIQGINSAKSYLVKWQEDENVKKFLIDPSSAFPKDINDYVNYTNAEVDQGDHYLFTPKNDYFDVIVTIDKASDLFSNPNEAHKIHISVSSLDESKALINETYGYVIVEKEVDENGA